MSNRIWNLSVDPSDSFLQGEEDTLSYYEISLVASGCCSSLAHCGFLCSGGVCTMISPADEQLTLPDLLHDKYRPLGGYYHAAVAMVISIVQSVIHAGEFMIPENHISLLPEDIFFVRRADGWPAPLLILRSGSCFFPALCNLCRWLYVQEPRTHGDRLEEALLQAGSAGPLSPAEALRVLKAF